MAAVAALVAALLRITGGRLPGLPRGVGGWAAALGFHGGLTSVLGLYLVFWVDLTILQAPSHAAPPLHVPQPAGMPAACTPAPTGRMSRFHIVDRYLCGFCLVAVGGHVTKQSANP